MLKSVFKNNNVEAFYNAENGTYILKHKFQAGVDILKRDHGYNPYYDGAVYVLQRLDAAGRKKKQYSFIINPNGKHLRSLIKFPFSRNTLRLTYALLFEMTGNLSVLEHLCKLNQE